MGDGKAEPRPAREARSLGWLTESAVQPRKRKEIEGVGTTSLLSLRSQLASEQQKAAAVRTGELDRLELRAKRLDVGLRSNPGVAARDAQDRASVQTEQSLLAASAAALERKADLYDRLASGSQAVPEELYEVDFELKGAPDTLASAANAPAGLISADMEAERERRSWEEEVEANRKCEHDTEERRRQRNEAIHELVQETAEARKIAEVTKAASERLSASRTAALKAAFLKKKLAALKAQKETPKN